MHNGWIGRHGVFIDFTIYDSFHRVVIATNPSWTVSDRTTLKLWRAVSAKGREGPEAPEGEVPEGGGQQRGARSPGRVVAGSDGVHDLPKDSTHDDPTLPSPIYPPKTGTPTKQKGDLFNWNRRLNGGFPVDPTENTCETRARYLIGPF